MEKPQKDINRKKDSTDEHLDALSGLFGLALILTLIWLMERFF